VPHDGPHGNHAVELVGWRGSMDGVEGKRKRQAHPEMVVKRAEAVGWRGVMKGRARLHQSIRGTRTVCV
jgi:hypothetical protein